MGRDIAAERRKAVERLHAALREGRLTAAEHRSRVTAADDAHTMRRLAELLGDLPDGAGPSTDAHRVRALDIHRVAGYLGEALVTGELGPEEYRKRLRRITTGTVTYATLKRQLDGVPGPVGQDLDRILADPADDAGPVEAEPVPEPVGAVPVPTARAEPLAAAPAEPVPAADAKPDPVGRDGASGCGRSALLIFLTIALTLTLIGVDALF